MARELNPIVLCFIMLLAAIFLIINVARPPQELFLTKEKTTKTRLKTTPFISPEKKTITKPINLSRQLLSKPIASKNLMQLSAGLVSTGNNPNNSGLNIGQGEQNTNEMLNESTNINKAASVIQSTQPLYPSQAQNQGIEGSVTVQIAIDANGSILNIQILDSNPPGIFEANTLNCIKQWRFAPAVENNKPVASSLKQRIKFELD